MAKRRCFSIEIIESTDFRKLSSDAKVLYFGLMAHADDEGVVINHALALCIYGIGESTLEELCQYGFIIKTEDVYIIKHWHRHNHIPSSKLNKSMYQRELSALCINERKEYDFARNV